MKGDYRLDKLDTRCPVCKLLSTLCRSDPAIARLRVTHIDLCGAEDIEDILDFEILYPLESVVFGLDVVKGYIKLFWRVLKRGIQMELHRYIPIIRQPPVGVTIGEFPVAHIKVKVYGTLIEGSEETVVERYLRVFANHGILYTINRHDASSELIVH